MIPLDDTTLAMWYVQTGEHDDWMAGLNSAPDGCYRIAYRFRRADPLEPGADPFELLDSKRWTRGLTKPGVSRAEVMEKMNAIAAEVALMFGADKVHLVERGPGEATDAFVERYTKEPYVHIRIVKPGDRDYDEELVERLKKNGGPR